MKSLFFVLSVLPLGLAIAAETKPVVAGCTCESVFCIQSWPEVCLVNITWPLNRTNDDIVVLLRKRRQACLLEQMWRPQARSAGQFISSRLRRLKDRSDYTRY